MSFKTFFYSTLAMGSLLIGQHCVAGLITYSSSQVDGVTIPDNDLNGFSQTITVNSGIQSITDVQLSLNIAGGYNGDYYAYLTDGTGFAVLLNRVGVTANNAYGYADAGFNITFSDVAANGDIHYYQSVDVPNGGVLTGTWQPDGRYVSPVASGSVIAATPRTDLLSSFDGLDADTSWTLFIADVSPGGVGQLEGWDLQITGNSSSVPELSTIFSGILLLVPLSVGLLRMLKEHLLLLH